MATWTEKYLAALRARDEKEKANLNLYNYCMHLKLPPAYRSILNFQL